MIIFTLQLVLYYANGLFVQHLLQTNLFSQYSGKIVILLDMIYIYLLSYQFDLNFDINSLNEIKNIPPD